MYSVLYCMTALLLGNAIVIALRSGLPDRQSREMPLPLGLLRLGDHYPKRCESEFKFVGSERGPRRVAAWRAAGTRPAAHVFARAFDGTALGQGIFGLNASLCRETAVRRDKADFLRLALYYHSIAPAHPVQRS